MRPAAATEEAQAVGAGDVAVQQPLHVPAQVVLADERLRQVEQPLHAQLARDLDEDVLDAVQPDLAQHLLADAGRRVGNVGMGESCLTHASLSSLLTVSSRVAGTALLTAH